MQKTKDPIGETLLKTRKERKVSVPVLAHLLGIPKDRIYKWEQGAATPQYEDRVKIEEWIKNGNWNKIPRGNNTSPIPQPESKYNLDANAVNPYLKLLEDNDRFFKTEYHNLLVSLNKIIEIGLRSEELIKLNLEHIGNVEAHLKEVEPDIVHEQINSQIAGMGAVGQKDIYAGK